MLAHLTLLALCACCTLSQPSGAYIPLYVEPCGTPASAPGQFFSTSCASSFCTFASVQHAGACIYSPGKDNLLYLAPCNTTDQQQLYSWGGRGEGGFVKGGGGCWAESATTSPSPAGDVVGLAGCGVAQGKFELLSLPGNLTQIFSNASAMCFDTAYLRV